MAEKKKSKMNKGEWWYHEKNVLLIELVKNKPMLYDVSCPLYSDNLAKKHAWKEIGKNLNTTGIRSKERWEQLRSQCRKKLKQYGLNSSKWTRWKYGDSISFLLPFMKERQITYDKEESISSDSYDYEIPIETIRDEVSDNNETEIPKTDRLQERTEAKPAKNVSHRPVAKRGKTTTKSSLLRQILKSPALDSSSSVTTASLKLLSDEKKDEVAYSFVYPTNLDPMDQFFSLIATTVKKFNATDQHLVKTKVFNMVSEFEEQYLVQNQNQVQMVFSTSPLPSQYSEPSNSQDCAMSSTSISSQLSFQTSVKERFHEIADGLKLYQTS